MVGQTVKKKPFLLCSLLHYLRKCQYYPVRGVALAREFYALSRDGSAVFVENKNGEDHHLKAYDLAFWLDVASYSLDDVAIIKGRCQKTSWRTKNI